MSRVKEIGSYQYHPQYIGKGSFCKVYKGRHIKTNEVVAIKKININKLTKHQDADRSKYLLERFWNEIKIIEKLHHTNIVKHIETINDVKTSNVIYIITEYCNGGDVMNYINTCKNRTENDVRVIFKQIISGITYLFSMGIIHRDLKPQNILLHHEENNKNVIKIIDFGFAKEWKNENEMFYTICGTPLYISPEIILGKKYTVSADLWSIGVILFELVFDEYPFNNPNGKRPLDMFTLLKNINKRNVNEFPIKKVSDACKYLLSGMLHIKVENRYSIDKIINHAWFTIDIKEIPKNIPIINTPITINNTPSVNDKKIIKKRYIFGNNTLYENYIDKFINHDEDDRDYVTVSDPIPIMRQQRGIYDYINSSLTQIKNITLSYSRPFSRSAPEQ